LRGAVRAAEGPNLCQEGRLSSRPGTVLPPSFPFRKRAQPHSADVRSHFAAGLNPKRRGIEGPAMPPIDPAEVYAEAVRQKQFRVDALRKIPRVASQPAIDCRCHPVVRKRSRSPCQPRFQVPHDLDQPGLAGSVNPPDDAALLLPANPPQLHTVIDSSIYTRHNQVFHVHHHLDCGQKVYLPALFYAPHPIGNDLVGFLPPLPIIADRRQYPWSRASEMSLGSPPPVLQRGGISPTSGYHQEGCRPGG